MIRLQTLRQRIETIDPVRLFWAIFVITIIVRLALFFLLKRSGVILRSEIENIALSLLNHGTFADPYAAPTGPTAHCAPVYPFLLSLLYRAAGVGMAAEWLEQAFTVLFAAITFGLLPFFSRMLFGAIAPGFFAGLIAALSPAAFLTETKGKEAAFSALLFLLCCMLTVHIVKKQRLAVHDGVVCGLAWGFLILTCPGFLVIVLAWLIVPGYLLLRRTPIRYLRFASVALVCAGGVLTPWTIRNYQTFGHLFFLRDNLGLELSVAQNDDASIYVTEPSHGFQNHPYHAKSKADEVARMGEYNFHQARKAEAIAWMIAHKDRVWDLTKSRVAAFWLSPNEKLSRRIPHILMRCMGVLGLFFYARRFHVAFKAVLVFWAVYPLPYYFMQYVSRYSYPLEWSVALMAGGFVTAVFWREARLPVYQRTQLVSKSLQLPVQLLESSDDRVQY